jgi:hypothetical protein
MLSLEEMESAQRQTPLKLKTVDDYPLINWPRVFAIAIGVLLAIYFSDCFRGTP